MMNWNTGKKRKKKFYKQFSKKQKYGTLQPGVIGILITCNNNERRCVREAYNVLNEYGDRLFGAETSEMNVEDQKDIESELELELRNLKNKVKRFQQLDTKVSNCLFIRTEVSDPSQLVYNIFEDIQKSQIRKTQCILRMLPVQVTCKAYLENIEKSVEAVLDKFEDNSAEQTFSIIVKIRYNNSIGREAIVASVYRQIGKLRPTWKADLKFFKLAVVVEILHTVCCLGIAKDYLQFRKYNLVQITEPSSKSSVESPKEEEKDEISSSESEDVKNDMQITELSSKPLVELPKEEEKDEILSSESEDVKNDTQITELSSKPSVESPKEEEKDEILSSELEDVKNDTPTDMQITELSSKPSVESPKEEEKDEVVSSKSKDVKNDTQQIDVNH